MKAPNRTTNLFRRGHCRSKCWFTLAVVIAATLAASACKENVEKGKADIPMPSHNFQVRPLSNSQVRPSPNTQVKQLPNTQIRPSSNTQVKLLPNTQVRPSPNIQVRSNPPTSHSKESPIDCNPQLRDC
jgi:hypothetical protein